MDTSPTSFIVGLIAGNPVILILAIDGIFGLLIAKRALHPILGSFDIALILQPLGNDEETIPKAKKNMTEEEQQTYIDKFIKGKILTMAYRKEFPILKQAFRIGKKSDGFTYKVNPKKVAFLQRTHRVYEYLHGFAYPISISYGAPERATTSKGMDMYVAQKMWGQAIDGNRKQNFSLPIFVAVLCIVAGLGIGFALFYGFHTQLGFIPAPYTAPITNSTTTVSSTASLIK